MALETVSEEFCHCTRPRIMLKHHRTCLHTAVKDNTPEHTHHSQSHRSKIHNVPKVSEFVVLATAKLHITSALRSLVGRKNERLNEQLGNLTVVRLAAPLVSVHARAPTPGLCTRVCTCRRSSSCPCAPAPRPGKRPPDCEPDLQPRGDPKSEQNSIHSFVLLTCKVLHFLGNKVKCRSTICSLCQGSLSTNSSQNK